MIPIVLRHGRYSPMPVRHFGVWVLWNQTGAIRSDDSWDSEQLGVYSITLFLTTLIMLVHSLPKGSESTGSAENGFIWQKVHDPARKLPCSTSRSNSVKIVKHHPAKLVGMIYVACNVGS